MRRRVLASRPYPLRLRRAFGDCPVSGRLRGPADGPPADGKSVDLGQGGRVGLDPRRRPGLQAAELDESAVHDDGVARRAGPYRRRRTRAAAERGVGGQGPRRRHPADRDRRGAARHQSRTRCRSRAAEGRGGGASAGAAGRASAHLRGRLDPGPARVSDRDRTGGPVAAGRRRRLRRGRGQTPWGDRRSRAADSLSGVAAP